MVEAIGAVAALVFVVGLFWENYCLRKQVSHSMELLASRSFSEYAAAKKKEAEPAVVSPEERERIAWEEKLREAENDPYSQA